MTEDAKSSGLIISKVAVEIGAKDAQVFAAVKLLDEGSTVPFIARYRKEATGGLDDTQLRNLEERLRYRREMEDRRAAILKSVSEQGKLTDELKLKFLQADTKSDLEDLYLPYKPKRRTKAMIAREAGLEPLADRLLADPLLDPVQLAEEYLNPDQDVADGAKALEGARHILMERFAETPEIVQRVRGRMQEEARIVSKVVPGKEEAGAKFSDYFDFDEPISKVPPHRALALFRGRREEALDITVKLPEEIETDDPRATPPQAGMIAVEAGISDKGRKADKWLLETARWTWKVKLAHKIETELFADAFERSEDESIKVFASNLRDLLLAAPAGPKAVLALDPGFRTGCKVAVVDPTGKLLETATIYPHEPQRQWREALGVLTALVSKHGVELIAVGNGTASRETDKLAGELCALAAKVDRPLAKAMVSEAGASVYSASEAAAKEFPGLDVSLRGAVSIARRVQDPLAELVKIDPKSIGVGQYQHDIGETKLARSLNAVVEDCVNAVGVDLNTASAPLLTRVSGLSAALAEQIVSYREENGAFQKRSELKKVPRLGPKAFEQAAGFLRVMNGAEPLDASAVHPEAYPVARKIAEKAQKPIKELIGDVKMLKAMNPQDFVDETFGAPTVRDILAELLKPGRDPRPAFKTAEFKEGVEKISDLRPGMILEGVVTNVAKFGAFVDVGVHQDGLVHISALADRFVDDPREIVRPGQVVKVKVLEVDAARKRIGLTMRMSDEPGAAEKGGRREQSGGRSMKYASAAPARGEPRPAASASAAGGESALAAALRKARGETA